MHVELSLRGLLTVFFRQQAKFFVVFSLIAVAGVFYLSGIERTYAAHGSFLIKLGQDAVPSVSRSGPQGGGGILPTERSDIIQSNIKILQSDDLLNAAVREFGVERLYPGITQAVTGTDTPEHAAVERLQARGLQVSTDSQSSLVDVTVLNGDAQVAKDFADRVIAMFIARQSEVYNAPQTEFLRQQITDAQKKMQDSEKEFQDFKQQVGIFNMESETAQLLTEKSNLSGLAFQAVTAAQATLSKLESDAAESMSTYRADSPVIKRINGSIAIARREVQKRQEDLNAVSGDGSALAPKLSRIDERLAYLEAHRGDYTALDQRVHEDEENYKYYLQRGEEARGNNLLNRNGITRISIVDKPAVPSRPQPRKRVLLLLAFLMTAGLFGLGTVLLFELTGDSIAYPEQVAPAVGLPVLASFGRGRAT